MSTTPRLSAWQMTVYGGHSGGSDLLDKASELIPKLEEYFGKRVTGFVMASILLGIVTAALKVSWDSLGRGIYRRLAQAGWTFLTITSIAEACIFIIGVFLVAQSRLDAMRERRARLKTEELLSRAENAMQQVRERQDIAKSIEIEAQAYRSEVHDTLAAANLMMEACVKIMYDQGKIGQDQADEIISMLKAQAIREENVGAGGGADHSVATVSTMT